MQSGSLKPLLRRHNDQRSMQPAQARWATLYAAAPSGSFVDPVGLINSAEGLNLGRCSPNFLSTPAKVATARW